MYSVQAIANWFINKASKDNVSLDQIKLMKLVYFAQGLSLALDHRLFSDSIEAWKYGPVISALYHELKYHGMKPITKPITLFDSEPRIDEEDKSAAINILKETWRVAGKLSGIQLSNWTHRPDSPWYKEWYDNGAQNNHNHAMSDDVIKEYFKGLLKNVPEQ